MKKEKKINENKEKIVEVYFDGSCLSNPHGKMGYGYHIMYRGDEISSGCNGENASNGNSNNVAEYKALILALKDCLSLEDKIVWIYGDSKLVINQMSGIYKIGKGFYSPYAIEAKKLLTELKNSNQVFFEWIPRELNTYADELSNRWYSFVGEK